MSYSLQPTVSSLIVCALRHLKSAAQESIVLISAPCSFSIHCTMSFCTAGLNTIYSPRFPSLIGKDNLANHSYKLYYDDPLELRLDLCHRGSYQGTRHSRQRRCSKSAR
ncbi:hypothetical protein K432DRAFT_219667 [Lepidopterella palustris CBS 459.81]|uniref:Uncharacterized protein n=1 Tax=Lepidopterella palustris CBS 459.81 TaxID=1314670 RepID=A0A8E2EEM6_9PEZI|nr:hypothetical protein K432DRAFT_219667 [Lepidopterella palustris CBS 459.81]